MKKILGQAHWICFFAFACLVLMGMAPPSKSSNPFAIDFAPKKQLTNEDYIHIQAQLQAIELDPLLKELYVPDEGFSSFEDFQNRCTKGIRQILIDPEKQLFPMTRLEKIGNGSDMCIVSFCSYNHIYHELIKTIPEALRACGFHGYFYYRMGGFPNPTGKEIKYAGVPYSFKIFMMLEAQQLGFNQVLWMDASLLPLSDPTPFFSKIDREAVFLLDNGPWDNQKYIFPQIRQLLKDVTGIDVVRKHISTPVLGLKMNHKKVKDLIDAYYQCVKMGTPFLSCFPEEFVLNALVKKYGKKWPSQYAWGIVKSPIPGNEDQAAFEQMRQEGYFFYIRRH